jgi:hypothetical protein
VFPPAAGSALLNESKNILIRTKQIPAHARAEGNTITDFKGRERLETIPVNRRTGKPAMKPHWAHHRLCHQSAFPANGKRSAWSVHRSTNTAITVAANVSKRLLRLPLARMLSWLRTCFCRTVLINEKLLRFIRSHVNVIFLRFTWTNKLKP